ncbi:MAG: restriction endonuclease subunit S [Saprospiraceae bacterium]|nr:restriction endonuclease subunit S [Candidatus Vicinibacter affinis]MBP6398099.1 restriction endonuclease subunit S [Saprospiraceae bacterium]
MKQGWEIKKLGEVCDVIGGGTPSKSNSKFYNGNIHWATVRDMKGDFIKDTEHKITADAVKKSSTNIIPKGNVIIATRVGLGKVCLIENDTAINQDLRGIVPKNKLIISVGYLFRWFKSISNLIIEEGTGATVQGVKLPFIKDLEILLPPLPEQQRIVAILDEAFAAIAKAKANAEQNLKNAKELFESYLQGVFENGNWEEKRLEEICVLISKGSSPKWQGINYVDEPGVLFITSENVGENTLLIEQRKYVEEKFNISDKKSILKNGDVLTNIVGASIGRTAIFDLDDIANINQAVCLIRCNQEFLFNEYLMYLLNSPFTKQHLHDNEVNNARANLSLGFFRSLSIPLPKMTEQKEVVIKIKEFHIVTKKLEKVYQNKIDDLEELKKSVLQKAFNGELRSPEGAVYDSEAVTPLATKKKITTKSPEGAVYDSEAVTPIATKKKITTKSPEGA